MADLIERLRKEAEGQSTVSRWLSEAKSRRQADNPAREDVYAWLKPEETTAWQAMVEITRLRAELSSLRNNDEVIGRLVGVAQELLQPLEMAAAELQALGHPLDEHAQATFTNARDVIRQALAAVKAERSNP